jgi:hypothetical protein
MDPMENDEIDFEYSESSARCEEMVSTYWSYGLATTSCKGNSEADESGIGLDTWNSAFYNRFAVWRMGWTMFTIFNVQCSMFNVQSGWSQPWINGREKRFNGSEVVSESWRKARLDIGAYTLSPSTDPMLMRIQSLK